MEVPTELFKVDLIQDSAGCLGMARDVRNCPKWPITGLYVHCLVQEDIIEYCCCPPHFEGLEEHNSSVCLDSTDTLIYAHLSLSLDNPSVHI